MLLIKNCKLIPERTEGTELTEGNLYLEDGKILKITPVDERPTDAAPAQAMPLYGKAPRALPCWTPRARRSCPA